MADRIIQLKDKDNNNLYPLSANPANLGDLAFKDSVGNTDIETEAITGAKLADNSVGSNHIIDGSITNNKLTDNCVKSNNIDWTTMPIHYSYDEIDTKQKWVNGKTIYKKTIYINQLPNASNLSVAHNIKNLSYVIDIRGSAYRTSDGTYFIISNTSHPTVGVNTSINVTASAQNIVISTGVDRRDLAGNVTIYYTKN